MFIIIWKYRVKSKKQSEFEFIYANNGSWADLFKRSAGYLATELLRDHANPQHYITIDRWESKEEYETFISQYENEYKALDAQSEGLTENESLLGKWETL